MNISNQLYQLQKIDSQIDLTKRRLEQIDVEMENNVELLTAQSDTQKLKDNLGLQEKVLNMIEDEVTKRKIKIQENESSLYGGAINNPKELQDIQSEIIILNNQIHEIEEQQLQRMIGVEETEKQITQNTVIIDQMETKFNTQKSLLTSEKDKLEISLHRIQQERSAISSQISPILLDQYENLRSAKQGVAIVTLQDNSCTVCGTTLTPSQHQMAKSPNKLFYCPTCQRIIYAG
jgi:predicted  nucleic acid-binding Zn-ribbon protein